MVLMVDRFLQQKEARGSASFTEAVGGEQPKAHEADPPLETF